MSSGASGARASRASDAGSSGRRVAREGVEGGEHALEVGGGGAEGVECFGCVLADVVAEGVFEDLGGEGDGEEGRAQVVRHGVEQRIQKI